MLRAMIWGGGLVVALLAGRAISDCCAALDEVLAGPPEPPQPTQRVRVIVIRVPVGEAPGEGEAA